MRAGAFGVGALMLCVAACGRTPVETEGTPLECHAPGEPYLVADIANGPSPTPGMALSSFPSFLTDLDGALYFTAFSDGPMSIAGGLYRSDATAAGTALVMQFDDYPHNLAAVSDRLVFTAGDGGRWGIWATNGVSAPRLLREIPLPIAAAGQVQRAIELAVGGRLYLQTYTSGSGDSSGLWGSDGTEEGTIRLVDSFEHGRMLGGIGDDLAFSPWPGDELWITDGTVAGTRMAVSLPVRVGSTRTVGDLLYFTSEPDAASPALWRTDGTAKGTIELASFAPGTTLRMTAAAGRLFFTLDEGAELWTSRGSPGDTVPVASNMDVGDAVGLGDVVILAGSRSLWRTDGTAGGTTELASFGAVSGLVAFGGAAYFLAGDPSLGAELWRSDGTATGTLRIGAFPAGPPDGGWPFYPTGSGDHLFYDFDHELTGYELWAVKVGCGQ